MITTLQNKPIIGIISGFSVPIFASVKTFLTNDIVLKSVSICGIWIGFFIAVLTGIIKIFEVMEKIRGRGKL